MQLLNSPNLFLYRPVFRNWLHHKNSKSLKNIFKCVKWSSDVIKVSIKKQQRFSHYQSVTSYESHFTQEHLWWTISILLHALYILTSKVSLDIMMSMRSILQNGGELIKRRHLEDSTETSYVIAHKIVPNASAFLLNPLMTSSEWWSNYCHWWHLRCVPLNA